MTDQEKLAQARKRRSAELDAAIAAFGGALGELLEHWRAQADGLLTQPVLNLPPVHLLTYLEAHLQASLRNVGYNALIEETIASYAEALTAAAEESALIGLHAPLAPSIRADLAAFQQIDAARLAQAAERAVSGIAQSVVSSLLTDQNEASFAHGIERHIDALSVDATRTIDTGLIASDRFISWHAFSAIENFRYDGPQDLKTRPFCRQHGGETRPRAEWEAMQNDMTDPAWRAVWAFCGGIACRHYLLPIVSS